MSKDTSKKIHERFLLDQFLIGQGITPTKIEGTEEPDFLIDLEGRKVGIEVTGLYIRSESDTTTQETVYPLLQTVESVTDRIVSKASEMYFAAGNPPVQVHILFASWITANQNARKQFNTIKRDKVAELIAEKIQGMRLQTGQRVTWRSEEEEDWDSPLAEMVSFIKAESVEQRFSRWIVIRAGCTAPLTLKRLQDVINEKAKKLCAYKKVVGENWLLIVADGTRSSQLFFVPPDFPRDSVSSPFARTYYFGYPDRGGFEVGAGGAALEGE